MSKGISLLETLVAIIIVAVLIAIALPYYRNAVENTRSTEVVLFWGQQKNFVTGYNLSPEQAQRQTQRLNEGKLKYFTGEIVCREKADPNELCWEAEFTRREDSSVRYKLLTASNFRRLMCVGLNHAGESFCESQSQQDEPETINGQQAYWIR
ncbi:MAG: hypothetical protein MJ053_04690 [Elusimicrobiaceae bacterium]|nr:hypothetical protein [Elusimicrobiaceae bacterium]